MSNPCTSFLLTSRMDGTYCMHCLFLSVLSRQWRITSHIHFSHTSVLSYNSNQFLLFKKEAVGQHLNSQVTQVGLSHFHTQSPGPTCHSEIHFECLLMSDFEDLLMPTGFSVTEKLTWYLLSRVAGCWIFTHLVENQSDKPTTTLESTLTMNQTPKTVLDFHSPGWKSITQTNHHSKQQTPWAKHHWDPPLRPTGSSPRPFKRQL